MQGSLKTEFELLTFIDSTSIKLPLLSSKVVAGFPSPADDYIERTIDLNKELIYNPDSTFCARVKGHSMKDAGIEDGDVVIIDKSIIPKNESIAVCFLDGDFTIKRIRKEDGSLFLVPANETFEPIKINIENDFRVWGIVTYIIKKV